MTIRRKRDDDQTVTVDPIQNAARVFKMVTGTVNDPLDEDDLLLEKLERESQARRLAE